MKKTDDKPPNIFKRLYENKGLMFFFLSMIFFLPIIMASSPQGGEYSILKNDFTPFIVGAIFIGLYIILLSGKIKPSLLMMFGGLLFVFCGFVTFDISTDTIDWNTLSLLSGMMIMVGIIKTTGLFQFIAISVVKLSKGNLAFIWSGFCVITAFLSAFLDNVTTMLIIAPITMLLTDTIKISSIPFLISEAICANIGGTSTLIGDPPNILIGSASKLSFVDFIINLMPISFIVLVITIGIFYFSFKKDFKHKINYESFDNRKSIKNKKLLIRGSIVFILTLFVFVMSHFIGLEPGPVALFGAIALMIFGRQNSEEWFKEIEWDIIFFFIGLFIMVKGLELQGILAAISNLMINASGGNLLFLSLILIWFVGIASSFLGAVPIVTTLIPILFIIQKNLGGANIDVLWWSMSLGACFGGNGTILGTACNMVTVSLTSKRKEKITFVSFFKLGYPLMIVSLILSSLYIWIFYFLLGHK